MKKEVVESNLKYVVWSGSSWAIFDALTASFLVVFAVALGASNTFVGVLTAVMYLAALVAELPGAKLLDFFSKKIIVAMTGILGRLGWVLVAFVPFLTDRPLVWLIVVYAYIRLVELLGEPGWVALVADVIPERMRGVVFGKRNMMIGLSGFVASLLAGFYLDLFPKESFVGFSSLFITGAVWAFLTWFCVLQIQEPREKDHLHHSFADAFSFSPTLWRFTMVCAVFYFAVMIASPFFTVYMLRDLGLSYKWFVIAGGFATLARVLSQYHFGRLVDRVGDRSVALVCMVGSALVPLSFAFITKETWFLIIPAQVISGVVWAGVDLAIFNLLLDYTDERRRAAQSALFNMIISVFHILGPLVGGLIADTWMMGSWVGIPLVFVIASVLRLGTSVLLISLPEVRVKQKYSFGMVVRQIFSLHPSKGFETRIGSVVKRSTRRLSKQ